MAFILSSCRDSDGYSYELFDKYKAYLESVREFMPESCMQVATADWWYNIEKGGPHDKYMEGFELLERNDKKLGNTCDIRIRLECDEEVLQLRYSAIQGYELTMQEDVWHSGWRYDEFSLHSPGVFCHTIEWVNGQVWKIMARDLKVEKCVSEV